MYSRVRIPRWRSWPSGKRGWAAVTGALLIMVLVGVGLASIVPTASAARSQPDRVRSTGQSAAPGTAVVVHRPAGLRGQAGGVSLRLPGSQTSCRAVAHVGDSTSVGMISPAVLPNPGQRLAAQYTRVGVESVRIDAQGGRSVVEALPGTTNGYTAAQAVASHGFHGCWVFALGTNDSADISAGSRIGAAARIRQMMTLAHGQPVLWVDVRTLDSGGFYAEANMQGWNAALARAVHLYPNLRVFRWSRLAQPGWYLTDGIHYTSQGYAARAHLIANALAKAFPQGGHSQGSYVG